VVSQKDLVLIVTPSHVMRDVSGKMRGHIDPHTIVVSASKGIEIGTHLTMSGILAQTLPELSSDRIAVLSGPSFAKEVARQVPTVITVAAHNKPVAAKVQQVFATPYFRVYTSKDMIGVELGGSVKNVIAIAAGIIDGMGLGLNTRAALITRGLIEMRRLGVKLGASPRTFTGTAGIGDLVLTCTGDLSRNHTVGKKIGQGMKLSQILEEMHMVAEGVKTARSVYNLSGKLGVEMPICHQIYHILYEDVPPKQALQKLMTRDLKDELDEH
jgi:glycerol-3-phosphate dehydrogenase (NAD(P)+)